MKKHHDPDSRTTPLQPIGLRQRAAATAERTHGESRTGISGRGKPIWVELGMRQHPTTVAAVVGTLTDYENNGPIWGRWGRGLLSRARLTETCAG